jgi:peptidoglycan hydrolase-like protein with peptidoglycan-binding domain
MPALAEDTVSKVQRYLNILGYDAGVVDGLYGEKTERALEVFYLERGQSDNNELNQQDVDALLK